MMHYFEQDLYQNELKRITKNKYLQQCLAGKTIVITGARGLLGSEFVDTIMYANTHEDLKCKIYAVVRNDVEARKRFVGYMNSRYFTLVKADLNTDKIEIGENIDYFIHGASNTHPVFYASKPIETILTSTIGTNNTLRFSSEHCCKRYVFLSSVEVYGENRGDVERFVEDYCGYIDANTLRAGYSEGKRVGEALCQAYRKTFHLDCVVARLARCYGPGLLQEDSKALSQFLRNAVEGKDIVLKSEGKQYYSYVYAADAVDAIITLLSEGRDGEAYNIVGRDSDIMLADLAQMIAKNSGKKVIFEVPNETEKEGYSKVTKAVMDDTKMKSIGWRPVYSIEAGVTRTIKIMSEEIEFMKKREKIFKLDESWEGITEIIPFGYGRIGRRVIKKLKETFKIPFVIENNPEWQERETEEIIKTFDEIKDQIDGRKIVVLTTELPYISIKTVLEKNGFEENRDFCILSRFIGEWYMKCKNQLCISKIDTIITSRCSLPCPHCAMFIHECKNKIDYPLQELCKNFDVVFSAIDYVMEYSLFGGEPLICKNLLEVIDYLMSNYGDRIGRLVLISNGKADPSDEVMNILQQYDVMISISDYTNYYDYNDIQRKLLSRLNDRNIEYSFNKELVWKDMGYPRNPAGVLDVDAEKHFKTCGHSTFCINNGMLYFCDAMFGAEVNTNYKTRTDDIVNIQECIDLYGINKAKMRILQYVLGDINEKGCPSFCQLCKGKGEDNTDIIAAGS